MEWERIWEEGVLLREVREEGRRERKRGLKEKGRYKATIAIY